MVKNGQEMVQDGQKCQEMVQKCQEMAQDGQEMFRKIQEISGDVRKWSTMVRKWLGSVRKWSKIVRNGLKWYKIPKRSNILEALKKNFFLLTHGLSAEGAKAGGKKGNAQPSSPFLWFNLFSVFFSFLFVQIFPYGQVDRLFQMSHGAISPSLMVLY